MTALQLIKTKSEIVYVKKFPAFEFTTPQLRKLAIKEQNARHLAMVRRGRK